MKNKTAIDILLDKLESLGFIDNPEDLLYESVVDECKKIEKKQIIEAFDNSEIMTGEYFTIYDNGEEYYNDNFK
jgi:hypothetical protein